MSRKLPERTVYTEDEKLHAFSVFAETQSYSEAARDTGIPVSTIHKWVNSEGGIERVEQIRESLRHITAHKYARIAVKAADAVLERLEYGDEILDRNNNIVRKKVCARDAMAAASMATDKHFLLTQGNPSRPQTKVLEDIAERLSQIVKNAPVKHTPQIIDAESA